MIDKKGAGTTISMWFVLLVVLAIGILFVILSGFVGSFRDSSVRETNSNSDFLLTKIMINEEERFIFEGVALYLQGRIERDVLDGAVMDLVNEVNDCVLLIVKDQSAEGDMKFGGYKPNSEKSILDPLSLSGPYDRAGKLSGTNLEIDGKSYNMEFYHGPCLEGSDA